MSPKDGAASAIVYMQWGWEDRRVRLLLICTPDAVWEAGQWVQMAMHRSHGGAHHGRGCAQIAGHYALGSIQGCLQGRMGVVMSGKGRLLIISSQSRPLFTEHSGTLGYAVAGKGPAKKVTACRSWQMARNRGSPE